MAWPLSSWDSLVHAAAGGLVVLAAGGLAVRLCGQPARRARLVVLTIAGAPAVPWLGPTGLGLPLPLRLPATAWWAAGPPPPVAEAAAPGRAIASVEAPVAIDPAAHPLAPADAVASAAGRRSAV